MKINMKSFLIGTTMLMMTASGAFAEVVFNRGNSADPAELFRGFMGRDPEVAALLERSRQWYDIVHLALQTDSTRVVSLFLSTQDRPDIDGVKLGHHDASHHGQDPAKLAELRVVELQQMTLFGELLKKLKESKEEGGTLLDRTIVLFGSNLGNASSHDNKNLPILVAGGGFKHGQHLAFDPRKNQPLCNLYVQFLRRLGADVNSFGSSNGTILGFELA